LKPGINSSLFPGVFAMTAYRSSGGVTDLGKGTALLPWGCSPLSHVPVAHPKCCSGAKECMSSAVGCVVT